MLTNNDIEIANNMSVMLMQQGTGLEVKPATPLDNLVTAMDPLEIDDLVLATTQEPFLSRHNAEQEKVASLAFDRLMSNRNFAKNTINPIIREIATDCDSIRTSLEKQNDLFAMDLVVIEPLRVFSSQRLEDMFSPYANAQYITFPENSSLSLMRNHFNVDNFLKAVTNSNDQWNSALSRLLLTAGNAPSEVASVIGKTDRTVDLRHGTVAMFRSPVAAINFLYADAILSGTYESDVEFDAVEMARVKGWYGLQLSNQVNSVRDFNGSRKLLLNGPDTSCLYVYDRRWDKLKDLIPVRTLVGLYQVNSQNIGNLNNVLSGSEEDIIGAIDVAKPGIESRELSNNFRVKVEETDAIRQAIELAIGRSIRDEEIVAVEDQDRLYGLSREFFQRNPLTTTSDVLEYIRRAVCHVIGHGSSAYQLLSDIDAYLCDNPNASLEKADLYASTRIVTQWLMNQTEVVSVATTAQLLRNDI